MSRSIAIIVLLGFPLQAEIIDRIAASVDYRVITTSEVERQIRVAAFEDGQKPDLSAARKQAALQTMIDQVLIQKDLENSHYPLPEPAELNPAIDQFKKEHFPSDAEYRRVLAEYGITEQDFRDLLLWQRTLLSFIQVRFETGIQISDQEISDYFEKTVKPAAEAAHPGQAVTLDDYRKQIQKTLEGQQVDRQMDTWLNAARRRARILIHEEALQ
ncbi:MAG TPA: SurA N-terminal domain-containing protein [Verrucomicrobiae bacterium]|nr:SurA N-terminal domain-containing protein [Verrucomicrobiae bacterium]